MSTLPESRVQVEVGCSFCGAPRGYACLDELPDGSLRMRDGIHAMRWYDYAERND